MRGTGGHLPAQKAQADRRLQAARVDIITWGMGWADIMRGTGGHVPAQKAQADRRLQAARVVATVRSHRLAMAKESMRFCTVTAMK